ncbi:MAG: family 43 glycosylhydrolase [Verrucomicrobia bacterium]|nr:family 43 glycosylhydrolase [Verrucomicrobiota bacterium]MCH8513139.1 family 43 glycosylhydrolase [Kiritimatiellia bacterium]
MKPSPLINEPGMSDPHALVVGDVCYLFTGHDVGFGVPDWVMPDWRIYRSEDLRNWRHVGTIRPEDCFLGAGNTSCWAGDIVARNGEYFWYFSHPKLGTGVMRASRPEGPYVDALGHALVESFDPTIFVEDDGTPYLIYGHGDYKIARLKDSMVELDETPRDLPLDRKGIFPVMDKNSLHKHNGTYYLSCSGYYATSDQLYGPYVYRGLVGEGWGLDTPYAHGDFFQWKNQWVHVWCKYRNREVDRIRDCYLAPVVYGPDGTMRDDLAF